MPVTSSFEVGTIFVIEDKATRTIKKLSTDIFNLGKQAEIAKLKLSKLGTQGFTRAEANLAKFQDRLAAINIEIDAGLVGMKNTAAATATSIGNLAREWQSVNVAASAAAIAANRVFNRTGSRAPAAGSGGRGGKGSSLYGFFGPHGYHMGGGIHSHAGGMVGQGVIGALLYGGYEQVALNDLAYRAMFTAGIPNNKADIQKRMAQFSKVVKDVSAATGASVQQIGEGALNEIRLLGSGISWKEKMSVMPTLLKKATAEARLKGSSIPEAVAALVGLAHMTKSYNPQQFGQLANRFSFLSTMVPSSITSMERAFGYNVPVLSSYGYDKWQLMLLDTMLMQAGIMNTKSGTWIRQLGMKALPGTSTISRKAFALHEGALRQLGLIGTNGHATFLDKNGNPDVVKMLEVAGKNINAMPPMERAGVAKQLFGTRGSEAFSVLSNPILLKMLPKVDASMKKFLIGSDFFGQMSNYSQKLTFMQTWRQLTNVLMNLSNTILPAVTTSLKNLNVIFQGVDHMTAHLGLGHLAGGALLGAVVGFFFGGPAGAAIGAAALGTLSSVNLSKGATKPKTETWSQWWKHIEQHPGSLFGLGDKQTIHDGVKSGVEDALKNIHKSAFWSSGGGGPVIIPASYGGGSPLLGNGVYYGGAGINIPSYPNLSAGGAYSGSAKKLMNDLVTKYHWSPEAAAVMAGNVAVESKFNPSAIGDHGTSIGLAQWHLGRAAKLRDFAAAHHMKWNDWNAQVAFMDHEWRERYGNAFQSHSSRMLNHLGKFYEGYATNSFGARVNDSLRYLREFGRSEDGHSNAIPPAHATISSSPVTIMLDGKTVAKSTIKHIIKEGNSGAHGSRLPDYMGTRMIPI